MNKKEKKKEPYIVGIGPVLMECLRQQINTINKESYGMLNVSIYDASEVLGKKILDSRII